ncbi:MAG: metallophosphatase family protein [Actinomycetota bacterium]|nr:metallophosphatase family protein [Actinomycetota bacterium]
MRIAILADTHMPRGSRRLPALCLNHLREADLIVHAGDFVTAAVLAELESIGPPVVAVYGNVDEAALQEQLPEERVVDVAGARLGVVHDAGPARGRLDRLRRRLPGADAVIFGHSHLPLHERAGDFQIFNPGSPTERRRAPHRSMGLATVEGARVSFAHVVLD